MGPVYQAYRVKLGYPGVVGLRSALSWCLKWARYQYTMHFVVFRNFCVTTTVCTLCYLRSSEMTRLDLIQPRMSSARSYVCTVCTVARPAHAISCSLVIWCKLESDSFRFQDPEDGSRLGAISQGLLQEDQCGSHLSLGYQMDELRDQKDLTSVQYMMTWDRLAMYVDRNV